jgi:hypothetical protein
VIDLFSKHHNRFDMNQIVTKILGELVKNVSSVLIENLTDSLGDVLKLFLVNGGEIGPDEDGFTILHDIAISKSPTLLKIALADDRCCQFINTMSSKLKHTKHHLQLQRTWVLLMSLDY